MSTVEIWYQQKIELVRIMNESEKIVMLILGVCRRQNCYAPLVPVLPPVLPPVNNLDIGWA